MKHRAQLSFQLSCPRRPDRRLGRLLLCACFLCALTPALLADNPSPSPRELFNAGTAELRAGKLRESEASLQSALATQNSAIQPPVLYNLGCGRFLQGQEALTNGPDSNSALARGQRADALAAEAIGQADTALAGNQIDQLLAAYQAGHGARKELKAAKAAIEEALKSHRTTLTHWQRASDDFKSASQLNPADTEARENAQTTDQAIAKLIDKINQMQQMAMTLGAQSRALGQKLKQLKGNMPASQAPPGQEGEDEDDEDQQGNAQQPGQKEGASKDGQEMPLSPEQAGWMLNGYKLDSEHRLPMGQTTNPPSPRTGATW